MRKHIEIYSPRNDTINLLVEKYHPMEYELSVSAELSNLHHIRDFIEEAARKCCDIDQFVYDIELAVDELVTNIIIHGYQGEKGIIKLFATTSPTQIEIKLIDDAEPFDPTLLEDPDLHGPLEERRIGGLGIYMAKVLTDEMSYSRLPHGTNELKLVKLCPVAETTSMED